ncbi:MAG: hypothetical protein ACLFSH_03180 [Phormidium sp.]
MGYVILPGSGAVLGRSRPIKPLILAGSWPLRSRRRASGLACQ